MKISSGSLIFPFLGFTPRNKPFFFGSDEDEKITKHIKEKAEIASLKNELSHLLSQPLVARGVSTKYITSGSRTVVDDIVAGTSE